MLTGADTFPKELSREGSKHKHHDIISQVSTLFVPKLSSSVTGHMLNNLRNELNSLQEQIFHFVPQCPFQHLIQQYLLHFLWSSVSQPGFHRKLLGDP
jgi:hypothetical protein